jgi:hypothetical protein
MMAEWPLARLMINDFAVARALHVLALVHWIGGVTMLTTIVLPRAGALADVRLSPTPVELSQRSEPPLRADFIAKVPKCRQLLFPPNGRTSRKRQSI